MLYANTPQTKTGVCQACELRQALPALSDTGAMLVEKGCVRCGGDVLLEEANEIDQTLARLKRQLTELAERVTLLEEHARVAALEERAHASHVIEDSRLLTS